MMLSSCILTCNLKKTLLLIHFICGVIKNCIIFHFKIQFHLLHETIQFENVATIQHIEQVPNCFSFLGCYGFVRVILFCVEFCTIRLNDENMLHMECLWKGMHITIGFSIECEHQILLFVQKTSLILSSDRILNIKLKVTCRLPKFVCLRVRMHKHFTIFTYVKTHHSLRHFLK